MSPLNLAVETQLGVLLDGWNTLRRAHKELEFRLREELGLARKITPDGHTVGSVGDCVAAVAFDLTLEQGMSNPSCDATTRDRRHSVEIKTTQRTSWAFRDPAMHGDPTFVVLLLIESDGKWRACWHGDAAPIYQALRARGNRWTGQRTISLGRLAELEQSGRRSLLPVSDAVAMELDPTPT